MTKELESIILATEYDLTHFPDRSVKNRLKSIVKKALGRGGMIKDPIYWPNGLLAKGLIDAANYLEDDKTNKEGILSYLESYIDVWTRTGGRVEYIDDAIFGEVLLELEKKELAARVYDNLLATRKDFEGSIVYRPKQDNNYILADMVGMVCSFLSSYGVRYNAIDAIDLANKQIVNFIKHGIDDVTGLPYHGYSLGTRGDMGDGHGEMCLGLVGWGRAVGWIMRGTAGYLAALKEHINDSCVSYKSDYEDVSKFFIKLSETCISYLRDDNLWGWELPAKKGHVDTSASAIIIEAMETGLRAGIYDETPSAKEKVYLCTQKGVEALMSHCQNGKIMDSLSESLDFAVHYQVFGHYPWGQGPSLSAICKKMD